MFSEIENIETSSCNIKSYHCANFGVSSSLNEKGVGIFVEHMNKRRFEKWFSKILIKNT